MTNKDHLIWGNYETDWDEWAEELREEYPEEFGDMDDTDMYDYMFETNNMYLEDARANLNIELDDEIIVIATLGLWNGHRSGYKILREQNIEECLYFTEDYAEFYVDYRGDLICDAVHHDGCNHYLYRKFKHDISDVQRENFLDKLYNGCATRRDITRYTERLGDAIANVYGWTLPKYWGR